MELEHMRRVLAEAGMGWEPRRGQTATWYTAPDKTWRVRFNEPTGLTMTSCDWHPDTDGTQRDLVIEAMQEKGWTLVLTYSGVLGPWVKFHKKDEHNQYRWATSEDPADSLGAEICAVAARALEANNGA